MGAASLLWFRLDVRLEDHAALCATVAHGGGVIPLFVLPPEGDQAWLGWQWTAGCGPDAAPYFRVFNPSLQGTRFDPNGVYVRRWVPELAGLDAKQIYAPGGVSLGEAYSLSDSGTCGGAPARTAGPRTGAARPQHTEGRITMRNRVRS